MARIFKLLAVLAVIAVGVVFFRKLDAKSQREGEQRDLLNLISEREQIPLWKLQDPSYDTDPTVRAAKEKWAAKQQEWKELEAKDRAAEQAQKVSGYQSAQQATSQQHEFAARFATGEFTPQELQIALSDKTPIEVVALIGRPDSTSHEDTEWAYHNRVLHPITAKRDTLVIKFTFDTGELRTAYLTAGYGGTQWPLK